jgi:hypothetical protein
MKTLQEFLGEASDTGLSIKASLNWLSNNDYIDSGVLKDDKQLEKLIADLPTMKSNPDYVPSKELKKWAKTYFKESSEIKLEAMVAGSAEGTDNAAAGENSGSVVSGTCECGKNPKCKCTK